MYDQKQDEKHKKDQAIDNQRGEKRRKRTARGRAVGHSAPKFRKIIVFERKMFLFAAADLDLKE
jgi:hypothetical protein